MSSILNDAFATLFSDFLYKKTCRYSFELPQLVEAIQMSPHNMFLARLYEVQGELL